METMKGKKGKKREIGPSSAQDCSTCWLSQRPSLVGGRDSMVRRTGRTSSSTVGANRQRWMEGETGTERARCRGGGRVQRCPVPGCCAWTRSLALPCPCLATSTSTGLPIHFHFHSGQVGSRDWRSPRRTHKVNKCTVPNTVCLHVFWSFKLASWLAWDSTVGRHSHGLTSTAGVSRC